MFDKRYYLQECISKILNNKNNAKIMVIPNCMRALSDRDRNQLIETFPQCKIFPLTYICWFNFYSSLEYSKSTQKCIFFMKKESLNYSFELQHITDIIVIDCFYDFLKSTLFSSLYRIGLNKHVDFHLFKNNN